MVTYLTRHFNNSHHSWTNNSVIRDGSFCRQPGFSGKLPGNWISGVSPMSRWLCNTWITRYTWSDNKVHELTAVKVLHTSLLNITVVNFKVLPLGSYAPIPPPSPPFKIILELVLWNVLQSCSCITPDVINVIKMPSFQYFHYLQEQKKKSLGARSGE